MLLLAAQWQYGRWTCLRCVLKFDWARVKIVHTRLWALIVLGGTLWKNPSGDWRKTYHFVLCGCERLVVHDREKISRVDRSVLSKDGTALYLSVLWGSGAGVGEEMQCQASFSITFYDKMPGSTETVVSCRRDLELRCNDFVLGLTDDTLRSASHPWGRHWGEM